MGASYSVWIPWDVAGGEQKKVTLCPMFISKSQRTTRGEIAKLNLSGKKADAIASNNQHESVRDSVPNNTIQLASATIPTVEAGMLPKLSASPLQQRSDTAFNSQMRTTTIRLNQPIHGGGQANANGLSLSENPQALQLLQSLQSQVAGSNLPNAGPGLSNNMTSQPINPGLANAIQTLETLKSNAQAASPSVPAMSSWAASMQPVGQSLSANGWVKPGQVPPPAPLPLTGFQPNQSPALGSTTGR